MKSRKRKGQFFIITAVLISGALIAIMTALTSSATVNYNEVLERHSSDILTNVEDKIEEAWWNTDWDYRRMLVVKERSGAYLVNESVHVSIDVNESRMNDDCSDIRVVQNGELAAWSNTTSCGTENLSLDMAVDMEPLSRERVFVYYGGPVDSQPELRGAPMNDTVLSEDPEVVERGIVRDVREVLSRMQVQVQEIDSELGADLSYTIIVGCDILSMRSPETSLAARVC
ncbi:MAG: hypothetical protein SVQ76_02180 [Candidatus Nanohaloarchaea archaeon]|nr:hypothetical protein [Candidatus Nanohaloarchaea archaeon]